MSCDEFVCAEGGSGFPVTHGSILDSSSYANSPSTGNILYIQLTVMSKTSHYNKCVYSTFLGFTSRFSLTLTNNRRFSRLRHQYCRIFHILVLFALSFVFLIATMIKSKYAQVNILKSSALAVMCGFSELHRG